MDIIKQKSKNETPIRSRAGESLMQEAHWNVSQAHRILHQHRKNGKAKKLDTQIRKKQKDTLLLLRTAEELSQKISDV